MYICNCNGISADKVNAAIRAGCSNPLDIYTDCGKQPKCGRCMERMWDMLAKEGVLPRPTELLSAE